MRNLLALAAAGLLVFIGLGWYLGWYRVQSAPGAEGHRQIKIDLNTKKISEDVGKGVHKSKEVLRDYLNKDDKQPQVVVTPPTVPPPVDAQPTGWKRGLYFNDDGSVTYRGNVAEVNVPVFPTGRSPR